MYSPNPNTIGQYGQTAEEIRAAFAAIDGDAKYFLESRAENGWSPVRLFDARLSSGEALEYLVELRQGYPTTLFRITRCKGKGCKF
jgi:hypothetical protein